MGVGGLLTFLLNPDIDFDDSWRQVCRGVWSFRREDGFLFCYFWAVATLAA